MMQTLRQCFWAKGKPKNETKGVNVKSAVKRSQKALKQGLREPFCLTRRPGKDLKSLTEPSAVRDATQQPVLHPTASHSEEIIGPKCQ